MGVANHLNQRFRSVYQRLAGREFPEVRGEHEMEESR
jgi:hypothetical protein